jgi:hypothetical protein
MSGEALMRISAVVALLLLAGCAAAVRISPDRWRPDPAFLQAPTANVMTRIAGYLLLYVLVLGLSFNTHDHFYGTDKCDAGSYMSHAFTTGLDQDLNYSNEFSALPGGCMNAAGTSPQHPMGPGILAAPFVAAFSVLDRRVDHPVLRDRGAYIGSWSYFAIQFATVFYFLFGIALYQVALRRWIPPLTTAIAVLASGLLWYVTYRFSFGHTYEFFALALLTAGCMGLCNARKGWQVAALAALVALATFLSFMVRWAMYGLLFIPLLVVVTHYLIEKSGRYRRALLVGYGGIVAGAVMVAAFHLYAFGIIWPTPSYFYNRQGYFAVLHVSLSGDSLASFLFERLKNLPLLVFSSEFGVLYTFPLFPIAILAALFLWVRNFLNEPLPWTFWMMAFVVCVGIPLATALLVSGTAGAYGYRYLLPAMPALMLSAAVFLNSRKIEHRYGRRGDWTKPVLSVVLVLAGFLAVVSFVSQIGFDKVSGFELKPQINVFGTQDISSGRGYMYSVFGALLSPTAWQSIYRGSLFHEIALPSLPILVKPQFVQQFRILLFVLPLCGAVLSAAAHAQKIGRFVTTSAVVLMLALLWPLTLPLAVGKEGAYEITNVTSDGYLTPESKVLIRVPGVARLLALTLEVPKWMPFDYPAKLQTVRDGHMEETFEFEDSGTHKIYIPLDKAGTVALKIDNWFVPAQLGVGSPDERRLAYRLEGAETEDGPAK